MKILLATSIVSPHLMPLAGALAEYVGPGNFAYAATEPGLAWRRNMGWPELAAPWILRPYASPEERRKADECALSSDVIITSVRDTDFIRTRVAAKKLTFYMSERWWKPPYRRVRLFFPKWRNMIRAFRECSEGPYFHYLPIGPYAAQDLSPLAFPSDHCHLWGYYTAPGPATVDKPDGPFTVLFVARMISWKHPEDVVRGFGLLAAKHPDSRLVLVGSGERANSVAKLIAKSGLGANVGMVDFRPMQEVWAMMERSHAFVVASGEEEGWGTVVNEAMSRRCGLVASRDCGASAAMLRHGENALLFGTGDWQAIGEHLVTLADDRAKLASLSGAAKRTVDELWSAKNAARRFLDVADALLAGRAAPTYDDGPMSLPRR
jgi:glycosyltransferase involved in cell wall biosynthesis